MIPMPETYLPYADIRRCGLQVTFEMVDVDAAETAETTVSDGADHADPRPHRASVLSVCFSGTGLLASGRQLSSPGARKTALAANRVVER